MAILNREQLIALGVVPDAEDNQYQPNGIDLTVGGVSTFNSAGLLTEERRLNADTVKVPTSWNKIQVARENEEESESWLLTGDYSYRGGYLIQLAEEVNIPKDCTAFFYPRSSLTRSGVMIHTAVWDAGFQGHGVALLTVHNPQGFLLKRGTRIGQLVVHRLEQEVEEGYNGIYQEYAAAANPDNFNALLDTGVVIHPSNLGITPQNGLWGLNYTMTAEDSGSSVTADTEDLEDSEPQLETPEDFKKRAEHPWMTDWETAQNAFIEACLKDDSRYELVADIKVSHFRSGPLFEGVLSVDKGGNITPTELQEVIVSKSSYDNLRAAHIESIKRNRELLHALNKLRRRLRKLSKGK